MPAFQAKWTNVALLRLALLWRKYARSRGVGPLQLPEDMLDVAEQRQGPSSVPPECLPQFDRVDAEFARRLDQEDMVCVEDVTGTAMRQRRNGKGLKICLLFEFPYCGVFRLLSVPDAAAGQREMTEPPVPDYEKAAFPVHDRGRPPSRALQSVKHGRDSSASVQRERHTQIIA